MKLKSRFLEHRNYYLQHAILREALKKIPGGEGLGFSFESNQLRDLLQFSYQLIKDFMHNAINFRNEPAQFFSYLDAVNQQIQLLLAIIQPYSQNDFNREMLKHFKGMIPSNIGSMQASLCASGTRAFSSALSALEKQKGTNTLHVLLQKDCYYEISDAVKSLSTYNTGILNGGQSLETQLPSLNATFLKQIDLFIAEFHHTISPSRKEYHRENVLQQVNFLFDNSLVNQPLTAIIDPTLNLERSEDFKDFF